MNRVRRVIGADAPICSQYTGRGVYVAVLDSGVARHPDLDGRVAAFRDFTAKGRKYDASEYCYDDNGHGTHV